MRAHELTTGRRAEVRGAGFRSLTGAQARLDSRRAAALLSCDLFRSAGIVPAAGVDVSAPRAAGDLSPGPPPRG
jgi:hypothetical protein